MNWGTKITLAFIGFIAFIMYMVISAFGQDFDLVAEDYYAQEINYQSKLEKQANLLRSESKVEILNEAHQLTFTFPNEAKTFGEIYFYHPSKKLFDRTIPIQLNDAGIQIVGRENIVPGNYRIYIEWTVDGDSYFQQEKLFLP